MTAGRGGAGSSQPDPEEADAAEGSGAAGSNASQGGAAGAAKQKLVAVMMKKFLADEMLPCLLELRTVLSQEKSTLAGALNKALMALLKEHKSEVCGWCNSISIQ